MRNVTSLSFSQDNLSIQAEKDSTGNNPSLLSQVASPNESDTTKESALKKDISYQQRSASLVKKSEDSIPSKSLSLNITQKRDTKSIASIASDMQNALEEKMAFFQKSKDILKKIKSKKESGETNIIESQIDALKLAVYVDDTAIKEKFLSISDNFDEKEYEKLILEIMEKLSEDCKKESEKLEQFESKEELLIHTAQTLRKNKIGILVENQKRSQNIVKKLNALSDIEKSITKFRQKLENLINLIAKSQPEKLNSTDYCHILINKLFEKNFKNILGFFHGLSVENRSTLKNYYIRCNLQLSIIRREKTFLEDTRRKIMEEYPIIEYQKFISQNNQKQLPLSGDIAKS